MPVRISAPSPVLSVLCLEEGPSEAREAWRGARHCPPRATAPKAHGIARHAGSGPILVKFSLEVEELVVSGSALPAKLAKKASKSDPLFWLFDGCRKKKTAVWPELMRYLVYVNEGGVWDANSSNPVTCYGSG
ncbi:hypothetical protein MLD38_004673 [Melastoma candidum]|uniref:Uncharacterized protein n=1 Tax=Melastoma candidum TaxID=119954 RepID=A0ACB9S8C3_9MYRT|nr:hypothetical protein MLD38_004673 [Melastoma candidum]